MCNTANVPQNPNVNHFLINHPLTMKEIQTLPKEFQ